MTLDKIELRVLEDEPSSNSHELASVLGVSSHQTVLNHLHQMDFVHKKPRQDPHELTEAQTKRRVEVCRQLLENPLDDRFWKRIVTSDKKWVYLVNHNRRKRWVLRGQDRFGKKVMICVWWNFEGVLHFELVPDGRAVNAELYCQPLDRVYDKLKAKYPTLFRWKRALFQQDNAKTTKKKFDDLDEVEVLLHPAYSSDAAPGVLRFEAGRMVLQSNPMLADRWQKIVEDDGLYFEE
ncbi:unnamed protein product [Adineta ricciae]|uniref:Transposase n=1 Tax=Adineta ricciae TaxID=249248 RepID=A0A815ZBN1_ADIRI|nr:unnamed protein product [Adineta ricciae]